LAGCGTRALIAARLGSYATSEKALTLELLPLLGKGMLVLVTATSQAMNLWGKAAATGADLLWKLGSSFLLPVGTVLADGNYLSTLAPPAKAARAGAAPIIVRVVGYHLLAADGTPPRSSRC